MENMHDTVFDFNKQDKDGALQRNPTSVNDRVWVWMPWEGRSSLCRGVTFWDVNQSGQAEETGVWPSGLLSVCLGEWRNLLENNSLWAKRELWKTNLTMRQSLGMGAWVQLLPLHLPLRSLRGLWTGSWRQRTLCKGKKSCLNESLAKHGPPAALFLVCQ